MAWKDNGTGIPGCMRAVNRRVTLGLDCESSSADARVESRPATNGPRSIACYLAATLREWPLSVARRVRRPDTTTPPGEASTPTDGLLRSATSAGRPTQLLFSWRRRSTSSEREKPKAVTSSWKNEEADPAQSAIPTAVLPGQECARGRHTRAPSGRHPPVRSAAEKDAGPPRQTSSSSSTAAVDPEGQPPLPSLWPPGDQADDRIGSVWMRGLTPRGKDACRALIRLPLLTRWHPSLMPLDRTQNAARARGCWRSSHDGRLT